MIQAKCNKCGGTAVGNTFEKASEKIDHAVALSRGIKCGDNYNMVCQIEVSTPKTQTPKIEKPKEPTPTEKPKEDIPVEKTKESIPTKEPPVEEKPKPTKSKSKK